MLIILLLAAAILLIKHERVARYIRENFEAGPMHWEGWHRWGSRLDEAVRYRRCERPDRTARYRDKAERYANKAERYADKAERYADKFERKAGIAADPEPQFQSYEERRAYYRARRQAAREAGFYKHLMVYLEVIGFLLLINLLTTGYPWFLWPAAFWGFGLTNHFMAVYGWNYLRKRIFEPAVQREVQREVLEEKEALHTEKQASLDELTATFAHEIRNPIAAAKSLVQQMGEDAAAPENVEYAKVALEELARVERSVSHLLKYAKEEEYHFADVNLASVLDSAIVQLRGKLEAGHIAVSRNYIGGPMIRADADKLRQVFSNVIDNAAEATTDASAERERRLEIAIVTGKTAGLAGVRIADNGCGIAPEALSKIFNPFYTTKSNGTGLGMAVAKKIVEAHRGRIEVHSEPGQGAEFEISLPLAESARMRGGESFEQPPRAAGAQ